MFIEINRLRKNYSATLFICFVNIKWLNKSKSKKKIKKIKL